MEHFPEGFKLKIDNGIATSFTTSKTDQESQMAYE